MLTAVFIFIKNKKMYSKLFSLLSFLFFMSTVQAQQNLRRAFQPLNVVNKIPYGNNPKAGHYVQANDARIYYEVYLPAGQAGGKKQTVVLLHGGLFGSTIEFSDLIDKLKKLTRLLLFLPVVMVNQKSVQSLLPLNKEPMMRWRLSMW
jgi:hypothetical protein